MVEGWISYVVAKAGLGNANLPNLNPIQYPAHKMCAGYKHLNELYMKIKYYKLVLLALLLSSCCSLIEGPPWEKIGVTCLPQTSFQIEIPPADNEFFYYKSLGSSKISSADASYRAKQLVRQEIAKSISTEIGVPIQSHRINMHGILVTHEYERKCETLWQHYCKKRQQQTTTNFEVTVIAKYSKIDFQRELNKILNNERD